MKIQLLSDLHNEFLLPGKDRPDHHWPGSIPDTDADIIVLAGDIDLGVTGVEWAISESERLDKTILYVPGNHEFYRHEYFSVKDDIARLSGSAQVFCLDPGIFSHQDVRFIGTTLWTDYRADISVPLARISHRMARLSRRALDLQGIFWRSGITVCIAEFRKFSVNSKNKRESVIPVRNAG